MAATPNGIAHLSYAGGGIFVPARTPYDRQMLVEQVVERVKTKGEVQILINDRRWIVRLLARTARAGCARCGTSIDSACTSAKTGKAVYCPTCAVEGLISNSGPVRGTRQRSRSPVASLALAPHPA